MKGIVSTKRNHKAEDNEIKVWSDNGDVKKRNTIIIFLWRSVCRRMVLPTTSRYSYGVAWFTVKETRMYVGQGFVSKPGWLTI